MNGGARADKFVSAIKKVSERWEKDGKRLSALLCVRGWLLHRTAKVWKWKKMCQVILVQKRASQMLAEFKKETEVQRLRLTASDVGVSLSVHIILWITRI